MCVLCSGRKCSCCLCEKQKFPHENFSAWTRFRAFKKRCENLILLFQVFASSSPHAHILFTLTWALIRYAGSPSVHISTHQTSPPHPAKTSSTNIKNERAARGKISSSLCAAQQQILPEDNLQISSDNQTHKGTSSGDQPNVNRRWAPQGPQPVHRWALPTFHRCVFNGKKNSKNQNLLNSVSRLLLLIHLTYRMLIGCWTGLSQSVYSFTIVARISLRW